MLILKTHLTPRQELIARVRINEIMIARKYFNASCNLCGRSIIINRKRPKPHTKMDFTGFLYHHLFYFTGEPRRKDYIGPNATWDYKNALIPIILKHPNEFLLLDKGCHKILESCIIKTKRRLDFNERLTNAVKMSKTNQVLTRT